mmetsp:Transcript_549/g.1736  ORF Transcript_549/g.1736 Transcript_549/m.1736 type:complete len:355 (+) Transcript_549:686-1750(+)
MAQFVCVAEWPGADRLQDAFVDGLRDGARIRVGLLLQPVRPAGEAHPEGQRHPHGDHRAVHAGAAPADGPVQPGSQAGVLALHARGGDSLPVDQHGLLYAAAVLGRQAHVHRGGQGRRPHRAHGPALRPGPQPGPEDRHRVDVHGRPRLAVQGVRHGCHPGVLPRCGAQQFRGQLVRCAHVQRRQGLRLYHGAGREDLASLLVQAVREDAHHRARGQAAGLHPGGAHRGMYGRLRLPPPRVLQLEYRQGRVRAVRDGVPDEAEGAEGGDADGARGGRVRAARARADPHQRQRRGELVEQFDPSVEPLWPEVRVVEHEPGGHVDEQPQPLGRPAGRAHPARQLVRQEPRRVVRDQ